MIFTKDKDIISIIRSIIMFKKVITILNKKIMKWRTKSNRQAHGAPADWVISSKKFGFSGR